jgi:DNA-binding GntR family transcriptional regulator
MDKPAHKYIQVENRIKEAIRQREIVDKLPGERVLAKEFGVSYMTMRKAIENLVTQNILYKIPARGTYVDQRSTVKRMVSRLGYFSKRACVKVGVS